MALVVNHNIPALQTYNTVNATSTALQKSIQKLSTGLRINSAADDAAGLAISEKMRAQIRGLDRAVANSQDGISMIQTAEGALNETHSILQRMRELSVQAANDTLTQQDRAYIQDEINELREEITRIGNTTQFNKKKLLDGSAAVLWSAGDSETQALVKGGLRTIDQFGQKDAAEGNYKIKVEAVSGSGEVKKTDIFKIKHERSQTFTLTSAATNASAVQLVTNVVGTNLTEGDYNVNGTATAGAVATKVAEYGGIKATVAGTSTANSLGGVSILVEVVGTDATYKNPTSNSAIGAAYRVVANIVTKDGSSRTIEKILTGSSSYDLGELDDVLKDIKLTAAAETVDAVDKGGKIAYTVSGNSTGATAAVKIGTPSAAASATYNLSDQVAGKTVDYIVYSVDKNTGDITNSRVSVTYGQNFHGQDVGSAGDKGFASANNVAKLKANDSTLTWGLIGDTANKRVKLSDVDLFWNSEGRFLLEDPQTLTITQGNGKQAELSLYQNDTMGDLITKLNVAIAHGLGQAGYSSSASKFAQFGTGNPAGALSTRGTIVISSVVTGSTGKLSFAGNEELLNKLSMNVIKDAVESDYKITITDAHNGTTIGTAGTQITGNKLIGMVHENVDVVFDAMLGITTDLDKDGFFKYTYNPKGSELYLHLADNTTVFQIGANEGEDMGVNFGDMRATALGLNSVLVTDRDSASRSITIIDNAIDKVSTQRAKLGAYQNRLEHTITNLTVAGENLTSAESRIRDVDMAQEMMNFTKLQIMLQAGTSMLAQANSLPQNVLSLIR